MHWSGAYEGYGTGSLDRDVLEMRALVKHLRENGEDFLSLHQSEIPALLSGPFFLSSCHSLTFARLAPHR